MNTPLTELQQFLGAYFNQDWTEEYSSADEVIDAFLTDSPKDIIVIVKNEILELINTSPNEPDLQNNLLHKQHCYYYYPNQWPSGRSWLEHVVEKFSVFLQAAKH